MGMLLCACHPKIYSFTALPQAVWSKDSVQLHWTARGKTSLLFDQLQQANPPGDSLHLLEFTLVAEKGNKPIAHQKRQVLLLTGQSHSILVLRMDSLSAKEDSLIAIGINDTLRWKGVAIQTVTADANRPLLVSHAGKTALLSGNSTVSAEWTNLPYSGPWEVKSPLSDAERNNHSLIPTRILLNVIIKPIQP